MKTEKEIKQEILLKHGVDVIAFELSAEYTYKNILNAMDEYKATSDSKPLDELIKKLKIDAEYYDKNYKKQLKETSDLVQITAFRVQRNLMNRYLKLIKGLREI